MLQYIEGDLFQSPAQVLVNTVNTMGVMGKGIALEFKERYPEMFTRYRECCEKKQLTIGRLMLFYEPDHWVLLFPTKENWRNPSRIEYIEQGLLKFVNTYAERNISSVAFPRLGCGNGELSWDDVRPIMEKYLKPLPINTYIYLGTIPSSMPEHKEPKKMSEWLKANAKDLSFDGLKDDISLQCGLIPYLFSYIGRQISVIYNRELVFEISDSKDVIKVSDDDFYRIWCDIRNQSVIKAEDLLSPKSLIAAMLFNMGYMSAIRLVDSKSGDANDGFQVNEGIGRAYAFGGGKS